MSIKNYASVFQADSFLKDYYRSNKLARKSNGRNNYKNSELNVADSSALKRAAKNLKELDYENMDDEEVRKSVAAFVQTYNNTLTSVNNSSSTEVKRRLKQVKRLITENKVNFASVGISVTTTGKLEINKAAFSSVKVSSFENTFSSKDTFTQKLEQLSQKLFLNSERSRESEAALKKVNESTSTIDFYL